jgi:hypothetical protein
VLDGGLDRAIRDRFRVFCARQKTPSMSVANRERSALLCGLRFKRLYARKPRRSRNACVPCYSISDSPLKV